MSDLEANLKILWEFGQFRLKLRDLLHEYGTESNPGWDDQDIVDALRALLRKK